MPGRIANAIALTWICALLTACSQNVTDQSQSTSPSPSSVPSNSALASTSPIPPNAASYSTALEAGIAGVQAKTGLTYSGGTCASAESCLGTAKVFGDTGAGGNGAAYVRIPYSAPVNQQQCGQISCGDCFAYVFFESGGWHYMQPVVCPGTGGNNPVLGEVDHVHGTGSCANVRLEPGLTSKVVACLKDAQVVLIDQDSPRYVDKHIWWSIDGHRGWMAHDFLVTQ